MIIAPMIASGRGRNAFIATALIETGVVLFVWLVNLTSLGDALEHWQTDGLLLIPFVVLWIFPLTMGGIILYARASEESPPKNICRRCGYDLRESPDRCPECGTSIHNDPERF